MELKGTDGWQASYKLTQLAEFQLRSTKTSDTLTPTPSGWRRQKEEEDRWRFRVN